MKKKKYSKKEWDDWNPLVKKPKNVGGGGNPKKVNLESQNIYENDEE